MSELLSGGKMARTKIDYGIDLGTTNSSISRMENGSPIIKKSTSGSTQADTTPSCVSYNKKQTNYVGHRAYRILASERLSAYRKQDPSLINTFEEFKRTMGTDEERACKNMGTSFSSEELSAEVLKALKGYVQDEEINAVVITVPAKFQGSQKDATKKAAELAGIQHCILLQEPIAASMAYGVDVQSIDGAWIVFDFGGGTFDVALMRATEGIMRVIDTEGDNFLGGKNIDYAIVDKLILPYLFEKYSLNTILSNNEKKENLRNALKRFAEETKISLSPKETAQYEILTDEPIGEDDDGNEIEIDLTVTRSDYENVVMPIFQRAVDMLKALLQKNQLSGPDLKTILMIGGPTYSETLRDMVRNQITENINISIDPMIAVAKGAALFASTKNIPDGIKEVDKSKVQLKLVCAADTVETEEKVGIQVLRAKTDGEIPEILFVELNRHDKGWGSGKVGIKNDAAILDVLLESGKPNGFSVLITDEKGRLYQSEPDSFSIIQGFKVAGATLPYDLCIDAYQISAGKQQLISLKGLMKNQPLPAKGLGVFLTQRDIRPGNKEDKIKIPVYYGEAGTNWNNNELRGEIIITGEQLPGMLPKGSEVELSVEIDESEMIKVSATFPYLDDEIVDDVIKLGKLPALSIDSLNNRLNTANTTLDLMEEDYPDIDLIKVEAIRTDLNDISSLLESGGSDGDTKNQVFGRLCKCQKAIDTLKDIGEWPRVVGELNDALEGLKTNSEQFGNEKTSQIVDQLSNQVRTVIQSNDQQMAVQLTEQIRSISFAIVDQGAGVALEISMIKGFGDNFEMHDWKDRNQARSLINEAKAIINSNRPTKDNLRPIVSKLYGLLPSVQEGIGPIDKGILAK